MNKKMLLAVVTSFFLQSIVSIRSANAGIGIYALGVNSQGEPKPGTLPGAARVAGVTIATAGNMALYAVQMFAAKYPFIDSSETIEKLVSAIKAKADLQIRRGKNANVSLDENEVRSLLTSEDLTEVQLQ